MKPIRFTSIEIQNILHDANFSKDEFELFKLRNKEFTYEECAEQMNMCTRNVYRIAKRMKSKIMKVIYWQNKLFDLIYSCDSDIPHTFPTTFPKKASDLTGAFFVAQNYIKTIYNIWHIKNDNVWYKNQLLSTYQF